MILNWKHNISNVPEAVFLPYYIFWKYMIITIHSGLNQQEIFEFGSLKSFILQTSNSETQF